MATNYTSKKLPLNNAERFKTSFSDVSPSIQYIFLGGHVPYANEASPNSIIETVSTEKSVWDNMFAAKRITANDVEHVIPRVNWTANTKYRHYDDTIALTDLLTANTAQNLKPVYVITSSRNVYKCLSNNASANSTVADPVTVNVPATASVLPAPTFKPTLVPVPAAAKTASTLSRSVLIFVPQVSVLAPTSGLVNKRFVVVVSAIFYPYVACCHDVELSAI